MNLIPTDPTGLILREDALRAGLSDEDLDTAVSHDHLVRVGPGVFALAFGYLLSSRHV
ncbi:type IV toxin-antitoxin system AbiEi family antitoxin domain-containing protein [Gordonia sp. zg691]|uniref:type IV toxin-antitoxin system AbiEi family antitoxin domain-containing protein n=1 Tax=Gordonia jinghuaiqii TaxID=2758710 RepID=UPI0016625A6A|nr:type IV toxin-antitoxin system AbiEi family antitoxin domain-containing protein [Gordonia jinghuaiqii]MBD0860542.1 type IV toxin-antitoxin system AbiEi family antitoxin domain-containing protein [Gordonia jinghuaiqii]